MVQIDVHGVTKATLSHTDFPGDTIVPAFRTLRVTIETEESLQVVTLFTHDMELRFTEETK